MRRFTIFGTVPRFTGNEFLMPSDNGKEFSDWIKSNAITTKFSIVNGHPAAKIRGRFTKACYAGRKIRHIVEVYDRIDGRYIRTVDVEGIKNTN